MRTIGVVTVDRSDYRLYRPIVTDKARLRPEKSEVERLCADNPKATQLFMLASRLCRWKRPNGTKVPTSSATGLATTTSEMDSQSDSGLRTPPISRAPCSHFREKTARALESTCFRNQRGRPTFPSSLPSSWDE